MPVFNNHKYTWSKPFTYVRHQWELIGPDGGVHFHVSMSEPKFGGPSCGLEFHRAAWSNSRPSGEAPSQHKCWLIGGPCWHDGTSLYASETVWPYVEPCLRAGDHDAIFRYLEGEYRTYFMRHEEEEAA